LETLRLRATGLGLDLDGPVRAGRLSLLQIDPAELSPGEFSHLVRWEAEDMGARVVVIDSLNGYLSAMPEERFLILHMHELLAYLANLGVNTLMVVAQHGMVETGSPPVDTSYLADTVILFRYFDAGTEFRQALSVMKKRSGAHARSVHEVRMGPNG